MAPDSGEMARVLGFVSTALNNRLTRFMHLGRWN